MDSSKKDSLNESPTSEITAPSDHGTLDAIEERIKEGLFPRSEAVYYERLLAALNQALVVNNISQRTLCDRMSISIGTMTKYRRAEVNPRNIKSYINSALAKELGVTLDALYSFYETGEYAESEVVTPRKVEAFIRSGPGQEFLVDIIKAASEELQAVTKREAEEEKETPVMIDITDEEAAQYGRHLADVFNEHGLELMLSRPEAWEELKATKVVKETEARIPGYKEICQKVLARHADLTKEQFIAIMQEFGFCPCHKALEEWVGHDLPDIRVPV